MTMSNGEAGVQEAVDFLFEVSDISDIEFRVLNFTATEALSTPYRVELTLATNVDDEEQVSFDAVMGKVALLTIKSPEGDRYFHGIISQFTHRGVAGRFNLHRAVLVPSLWLTSLEQDCRIFQDKSVPDIIKEILGDRQISKDHYTFRLQAKYQPRNYCVQYRETDLNFVSRLLEEEGIFYFFEHTEDKHLLVFGDGTVNYQPISGDDEIRFHISDSRVAQEQYVSDVVLSRCLQPEKVILRDFNYENPEFDLSAPKPAQPTEALEVYDYPGEYVEEKRGKRLAQIRLEEAVAFTEKAEGRGNCPRFTPAFVFTLTDHEREDLNQEYLLVEVTHVGSQEQALEEESGGGGVDYSSHFVAIPSSVTFRPERNTPKPVVEGLQTAIVVGPEGEEIYTEEYGRVKVRFHWDRRGGYDENSSCWVRVASTFAGGNYGAIFNPRIGQEVIVDFVEGDPDRPVVTGSVYNKENMPPYPLPAEKTKSTIKTNTTPMDRNATTADRGFNEIRFEDKRGAEELFIHGQKNLDIRVNNDRRESIGNDRNLVVDNDKKESVGNDRSESVGNDHKEKIVANRSLKVGGEQKTSVDGSLSLTVGGNVNEVFNADHSETVAGKVSVQGSTIVLEGSTNITLKVGGSYIAISPAGVKISSSGQVVVEGTASTEVTSSGILTIKGSLVQIN